MEYFLGSLFTFFAIYIVGRKSAKFHKPKNSFRYSQSHIHAIIKPLLDMTPPLQKNIITQAIKHERKTNVKVIIIEDHAYWIKDNLFYIANFTDEGIEHGSERIVDIMGMDKVELDKMLFIIDQLRSGEKDDSGSSGN